MAISKLASLITCGLFLIGCSSQQVQYQKYPTGLISNYTFPRSILIPNDPSLLTDEKLQEVIAQINSEPDYKNQKFLLRDLIIKGNDLKESGDANRAAFVYKILINFYPQEFFIHRDLVVSLIRGSLFDEAEKYLKQAIEIKFEETSSFMLILAGLYSATGREKESMETYRDVLKIDKANEEACIFLAKNLSSSGDSKAAIKTIKGCITNNPNKPIFYYYAGKIYLVDSNNQLADKYFKKALEVDPNYYQAVLGRGLLKEDKEDYLGASKIYQEYLKNDEENVVILSRLVQTLFVLEKFDNIIPYMEELIRQDSSNVNLKVKLGILYTEEKEFKKAISIFESILKIAPNSDKILYYLGALYQQLENFEKAIVYYSMIDNSSELFFDSNLQISKLLRGLVSQYDKKSYLEKLQFVRGKLENLGSEEALLVKDSLIFSEAYFLGHHHEYQSAINIMKKISNLDIGHKYFMANLYDKVKRYEDAIALMMSVIEENPENAHALNFVGYLILENDSDFDKAYKLIKKAVEIEPNDAYIRDSLGWYFFKIGDFSKALVELKKAWNAQKSDVIITKHLAIVYQKLNNDLEAQKYFVEALKNCTEKNQKQEILDVMERRIIERLPASVTGQ